MSKELAPRPRILIVDDDPLIRRVIIQSLDRATYDLSEAESGMVGVEMALQQRPDLIILDIIMPGLDGFEVIHRLRRHPLTQGTPIIMLTGLAEMNEKVRGMQLGADDYITKPFDPRELRARVQAHLKRSEQYLQSSPLTNLPGNPAIQQVIAARIAAQEPVAVMYLDLSNFKMYNDKYGWLAGDQLLKELGEIIVQTVLTSGDKDDFVGHVGGDDFVILTRPNCAETIAQKIIHDFDERLPEHYNKEDRDRGFIEGEDRTGVVRNVPLATIAIAIITNEHRDLFHPLQVAQLAAEVKRYLKTLPGSQYGYDRRRK
ncbi:MAG: response regulator [Anaerolineae bacterium]